MTFFSLHHLKITKYCSRWKREVVGEEREYTVLERRGLFDLGDAAFEPYILYFSNTKEITAAPKWSFNAEKHPH